MQYAQVVPNTKTDIKNSKFTYKIPPEILPEIKVGQIVQIPFGNRKLDGVIFDLNKQKPIAAQDKFLKSINKILAPKPQITKIQKKLINWISEYYYSTSSEVVFSILPSPILRKSSKEDLIINDPKITAKDEIFKNRFYNYKQLIEKNKNRQTILLFPTTEMAENFYFYFEKIYHEKVILYHAKLSKSEKWRNYQKILNQEIQIVIGSQIAIFAPLNNIGEIIIDDANSDNYKQDQSPRYDARKVAEYLAKLHRANLTFFSPTIPLDYFKNIKSKQISWLKPKSNYNPEIKIADLNHEFQRNNYGMLSEIAKQKILENFENHKKSILFINKKGLASLVLCQDCKHIFRCPNCESTLVFKNFSDKSLICPNCTYKNKEFSQCPKCSGTNLKFLGGGTEKINEEIKNLIPNTKILRIEKDEQFDSQKDYDIIIATQKIFHTEFKPVDLVVVIQPDLNLNLPDFRAPEKIFNLLKWLKLYAKEDFIIQTLNPNKKIFQAIKNNNDVIFYNQELTIRKKENYPPFSQIIKIFITDKNQKTTENEAKKLFEKFLKAQRKDLQILGPSPSYYIKKHDKYIWQIILIGNNLHPILELIPKNFKIDIDPISLL